ncbi:MAG: hypothetical protein AMJ79_15895 [Phycisphaerae bacterium SM23_30]|nr:MAG: hypothetical protein AMJ79_15895 [Phycisphaerae bacterium SM23_30]
MNKIIVMIGVTLIMGGGFWSYGYSQSQQVGPSAPVKIAVVNVTKVIVECQEYLARQKMNEENDKRLTAQLNLMRTEAEAIKAELDANVFKPGSKEYKDQMLKYFEKVSMMETFQKSQQQLITMEHQTWMEGLYQKLLTEVTKIAQQEGISLVLNNDETDVQATSVQELNNMIISRKVLYRTARIDITDRVLKNMDAAYAQIKQSP